MATDLAVRISKQAYEIVSELAKKEQRSKKTIVKLAIIQYKELHEQYKNNQRKDKSQDTCKS